VGGTTTSTFVDDTFICHGILKGGSFRKVIEEIHLFLCDHPGEFVVLDVVYERDKHEMSSEQQLSVLQLLSSTFDATMVTQEDVDSWFHLPTLTLGELQNRGKNILLLINDHFVIGGGSGLVSSSSSNEGLCYDFDHVAREFGCHRNGNFMKNKWHDTDRAHTLLQRNETFLEGACNDCHVFMNSQFVLTPQPPRNIRDALGLLFGAKSLRPVSLARDLYRKDVLEAFIRDNAENKWNIVLLDFVDLCPQLVRFLIGLNSPKHMTIQHASVSPKNNGGAIIDVTKRINTLMKRNCCLYLLDFTEDLELISVTEGTLRIDAQFDGEDPLTLVIPFGSNTEYLLCDA